LGAVASPAGHRRPRRAAHETSHGPPGLATWASSRTGPRARRPRCPGIVGPRAPGGSALPTLSHLLGAATFPVFARPQAGGRLAPPRSADRQRRYCTAWRWAPAGVHVSAANTA